MVRGSHEVLVVVSIGPGRLVDRSHVLFRAMIANGWNYPVLLMPAARRRCLEPRQVENAAAALRYLDETPVPVLAQPVRTTDS
jgi:hypothetical protein